MPKYQLKPSKIGNKAVENYKKIENAFTNAFLQKSEESENEYTLKTGKIGVKVIDSYKAIEDGVVGAYRKVEEKFIKTFLEEVE